MARQEVTVPEAAALLGVSGDTVKRMARRGELPARKDGAGRWHVAVDVPVVTEAEAAASAAGGGPDAGSGAGAGLAEMERLRLELSHEQELVRELRGRMEEQARQLEAQRQQIAQDATERAELRRLLAGALQLRALPAPTETRSDVHAPAAPTGPRAQPPPPRSRPRPPWWRRVLQALADSL